MSGVCAGLGTCLRPPVCRWWTPTSYPPTWPRRFSAQTALLPPVTMPGAHRSNVSSLKSHLADPAATPPLRLKEAPRHHRFRRSAGSGCERSKRSRDGAGGCVASHLAVVMHSHIACPRSAGRAPITQTRGSVTGVASSSSSLLDSELPGHAYLCVWRDRRSSHVEDSLA
jgi:hypothetical protein